MFTKIKEIYNTINDSLLKLRDWIDSLEPVTWKFYYFYIPVVFLFTWFQTRNLDLSLYNSLISFPMICLLDYFFEKMFHLKQKLINAGLNAYLAKQINLIFIIPVVYLISALFGLNLTFRL